MLISPHRNLSPELQAKAKGKPPRLLRILRLLLSIFIIKYNALGYERCRTPLNIPGPINPTWVLDWFDLYSFLVSDDSLIETSTVWKNLLTLKCKEISENTSALRSWTR